MRGLINIMLAGWVLLHHCLAGAYMPEGPFVEVDMLERGLILNMRKGLNQIKRDFPGRRVYIITISIKEYYEKGEGKKVWIVSNDRSENCKPEFPAVIKYGQSIDLCLRSRLIAKYNSKKDYVAIVMGYVDGVGGVEFTVDYKREVNGKLVSAD